MARTVNYNLELIDFNKIPWHSKEHDNWRSIDAIFANFITINEMKGVWQNATAVTVGQRFVDAELGTIWTVAVAHTTSSTTLFDADRTANPTYWELFSEVALAESWATSLAGLVNNTDYSSKAYAIGLLAELPAGSAKRWAVEVEDTVVITGSYSALHHAAKAAASAIATAADLVNTNQDTIDTAANLVLTNADVVLTGNDVTSTNADVVTTTQDAIDTAADVIAAAASAAAAALSATQAQAAAQGWADTINVTAATTNIEVADARNYYLIDATSNTCDLNLPAIGANDGILFGFQVSNVDNAITIVRDGTDTINDVAGNYTALTTVGQVVHFIGDDQSPDNWLATIVSQVGPASDTQAGIVELATNAETVTGTATDRAVTPANVSSHYSTIPRNVTVDTSTALNSALTHEGGIVTMNNASANVYTIEPAATIAHSDDAQIDIIMLGAGVTSVTADTGVTLNGVSAGTGVLAQYQGCTLLRVSSNVWVAPALGTVA